MVEDDFARWLVRIEGACKTIRGADPHVGYVWCERLAPREGEPYFEGKVRTDYRWTLERYRWPDQALIDALEIPNRGQGWPYALEIPKKYRGHVVRLVTNSEDGRGELFAMYDERGSRVLDEPELAELGVRKRLPQKPRSPETQASIETDPAQLATLAEMGLGAWVAQNPACPPDLLAILARSPDPKVRMRVAGRVDSTTSHDVMMALAHDSAINVREWLASNWRIQDLDTLTALANDRSAKVRKMLLSRRRRDLPPDLIAKLLPDEDM